MNRPTLPRRHAVWLGAAAALAASLTAVFAQPATPAAVQTSPMSSAAASAVPAASDASVALAPAAAAASAVLPPMRVPAPKAVSAADADPLVAKGRYLAQAADCVSCHTAPGG